jgi:integrase
LRLLILTGCRREEIGSLCWSEVDGSIFSLPAKRSKIGQPRRIPLAPAAKAILLRVPQVDGRDRVFPTVAWSYIKSKLPALDEPWTLHDLRRTMRTGLSRLGIEERIAERCIGHAKRKIVRIYDKEEHLTEQATAFARWAAHVEGLVAGEPSNVVSIRVA